MSRRLGSAPSRFVRLDRPHFSVAEPGSHMFWSGGVAKHEVIGVSAARHPGLARPLGCATCRENPSAVKAFTAEDDRPFEAWIGSAVPASACPPTASALPHVFAAIVASDLDAAVRLAVF
jgi:hypothetical protein